MAHAAAGCAGVMPGAGDALVWGVSLQHGSTRAPALDDNTGTACTTSANLFPWLVQLLDALEWCLEMGVSCVSVYAFSIDNFKRPPQEVAMLMQLAEEKLEELLQVQ